MYYKNGLYIFVVGTLFILCVFGLTFSSFFDRDKKCVALGGVPVRGACIDRSVVIEVKDD